jgi:hypothetical protein
MSLNFGHQRAIFHPPGDNVSMENNGCSYVEGIFNIPQNLS